MSQEPTFEELMQKFGDIQKALITHSDHTLSYVCMDYGTEFCVKDECRIVGMRWESCYIRKILNITRELPLLFLSPSGLNGSEWKNLWKDVDWDQCPNSIKWLERVKAVTEAEFKRLNDVTEGLEKQLQTARDNLYDALPSGTVDAFDLIKIIHAHIEELDSILEETKSE